MKRDRGRIRLIIVQLKTLIILTLTILISCATPPPPEEMKPPESLTGLFSGHEGMNGYGVIIEIRFFPENGALSVSLSGTTHIRSLWEEDGSGYSESGDFSYWPDTGLLDLRFTADTASEGFSVRVGGNPPEFTAGDIRFVRQSGFEEGAGTVKLTDITGTWMMLYEYDGEPVEVFLRFDDSGLFTEVTRYYGGEDELTEEGRFELDGSRGLVSFYYSSRPDVKYTGFIDHHHGLMYTRDGDFSRM